MSSVETFVFEIVPDREGIEGHWREFPDLEELDHQSADPYHAAIVRELAAHVAYAVLGTVRSEQ